jgi:hypothetical protein
MIRYSLQCHKGHAFVGWFSDSRGYDAQVKRGLVTCPDCGTAKVEKALMTPNLGTRQNKKADAPARSSLPVRPGHERVVMPRPEGLSAEQREMLQMLRDIRKKVEESAEYVGPRFAEEARKIHYDDVEPRGIYGEATLEEAKALLEEGIACLPLPVLPEDKH